MVPNIKQIDFQASVLQSYIVVYFYTKSMKSDLTCVFEGLGGHGAIYISGLKAAQDLSLLKKLKITAILSVARGAFLNHPKQDIKSYLYLPADDVPSFDLSQYFKTCIDFIDKVRRNSNILIHCMAGISRSVTITAAYLMHKYEYSLNNVMELLSRRRKQVCPNPGFRKQLETLEQIIIRNKHQRNNNSPQKLLIEQLQYNHLKISQQNITQKTKNEQNYSSSVNQSKYNKFEYQTLKEGRIKDRSVNPQIKRQFKRSSKTLELKIQKVKSNLIESIRKKSHPKIIYQDCATEPLPQQSHLFNTCLLKIYKNKTKQSKLY